MKKLKKVTYLLLNYTGEIKIKTNIFIDKGINIYNKLADKVCEHGELKVLPEFGNTIRLFYDDYYGYNCKSKEEFESQYNVNASKLTGTKEYGNCLICKVNEYDYNDLNDWEAHHMGTLSKEDIQKIMHILKG